MKSSFLLISFVLSLNASDYSSLLYQGNCTTCHHDTKEISAPSMKEVRENYRLAYPKKSDFIKAMSKWVDNPHEATSMMAQAVNKYELMPQLYFQEDVLKEISAYIYDADFK
ncbi:MAG: cytochrome C [Sulfurimonas sp.]